MNPHVSCTHPSLGHRTIDKYITCNPDFEILDWDFVLQNWNGILKHKEKNTVQFM